MEEKKLEVLGGFRTIGQREQMKRLFDKLKASGIFKEFKSYEDWELATYKQDIEKAKEFASLTR